MAEIDKDTSEQYQGKTFVFPEKKYWITVWAAFGSIRGSAVWFCFGKWKKNKDTKRQQGKDNYSDWEETGPAFTVNDPRM